MNELEVRGSMGSMGCNHEIDGKIGGGWDKFRVVHRCSQMGVMDMRDRPSGSRSRDLEDKHRDWNVHVCMMQCALDWREKITCLLQVRIQT
jgi:hypothetical protein